MTEHYAANMGYEQEGGTRMLAQSCVFCHRDLRDPESVERGCGPYCAEKHGVFVSTEPMDQEAFEHALETAPPTMRASVAEKMPNARKAVSAAIHAAGHAWETNATDKAWYIGSAMEITSALGYPGTYEALKNIYILGVKYDEEGNVIDTGKKPPGIVVVDKGNGQWQLKLPGLESNVWRPTMDALKAAGIRNRKDESGNWESVFPGTEIAWLKILNAMVATLAGRMGVLPNGEIFVVPREKQPVPEPSTAQAPAGTGPEKGTSPEPGTLTKDAKTVDAGDHIWYKGEEMVVAWVSPDRVRVIALTLANAERSMAEKGFLHGRAYGGLTMGMRDVRFTAPTQKEKSTVEEDTGPLKKEAVRREFPETMFPYQREAAIWLCDRGSGILAYDQGTGKSVISLAAADAPVLIVCKSALKVNWMREVARWRPDWTTMKLEGKDVKKPDVIAQALKADVLIVNYDVADRFVEPLEGREFKTLICDESHYIKTLRVYWKKDERGRWEPRLQGSNRAKAVWQMAQPIERRFMLSGTPMANKSPCDLFSQLNLVAPREFPSFRPYGEQYCDPKEVYTPGGRTVIKYEGASNTLELHERISGTYMIRKTKEEVLPDLPKKWRQTKLLTLSEDIAKDYERAAKDLLRYIKEEGGWEAMDRASRAEAMVKIATLRRLCAMGKVEGFVEEVMEQLESGRPLVVMAFHREAQIAIYSALKEAGVRVGRVSTDQTKAQYQQDIDAFQQGLPLNAPVDQRQFLDVLVCSIEIAKEGITLTRASEMYFLERVWSPFALAQAEDRIHRIGSVGDKVTITYFDAAGTIDEYLGDLLMGKLKTAKEVLEGVELSETEIAGVLFGQMIGKLKPNRGGEMLALPGWVEPEV